MRGIRYISMHEPSGYGEAARRYLGALRRTGIPLTWTPMVRGSGWRLGYQPYHGTDLGNAGLGDTGLGDTGLGDTGLGDTGLGDTGLAPLCNAPVDYDTVIVHTVPEYFPIWRQLEPNRRLVGYTVWETDRPPAHWVPLLGAVDGLLVPCRWNRQVFADHGVRTPIDVVPHMLCDGGGADARRPRGRYTFYTIATWTARKALWRTVECYLDAFTADEPVELVLKTSAEDFCRSPWLGWFHRRSRAALRRLLRGRRRPPRITLRTERLSAGELRALHLRGDCYVSLARSEGWGLGLYDAARLGNAVISTGFGGQLDYLPAELAHLVDYELVPVEDRQGRGSYTPDQRWAEPDRAGARRRMRWVYEHPGEARQRGAALRDHLERSFADEAIVERLVRAIGGQP